MKKEGVGDLNLWPMEKVSFLHPTNVSVSSTGPSCFRNQLVMLLDGIIRGTVLRRPFQ